MDRTDMSGRDRTVDWSDRGYELFDVNGERVGDIIEVNPDYLVVQYESGLLEQLGLSEPSRMFVPRDSITRDEGERWYLNISKDQLDEQRGWSERPAGSSEAEYDEDYDYRGTEAGTEARADTGGQRRTRLVRYEEDLDVDKVSRQSGEVTVGKHVVEENKTFEVPVRREEVHIERHPVGAGSERFQSADEEMRAGDAFKEDTITMPLMEEDVEVRKVARPVEEVEISKTSREETRHVDDTVRREEFDIDDDSTRRGISRET